MPWPSWEIAHKPLVVFNSAKYADIYYEKFSKKPEFATAEPSASQLEWAGDYVVKVKEYRGEEAVPYNAQQLAQAMVVGESKALLVLSRNPCRFLITSPSSVVSPWS